MTHVLPVPFFEGPVHSPGLGSAACLCRTRAPGRASAACKEAVNNTLCLTGEVKASAQRVAGELQRELSIEEARVHAVN